MVLAEDKQYYASAEQIYGADVEVLVQDEDTQPIEKPIIEPPRPNKFMLVSPVIPETSFDFRFLAGLMDYPRFIRHVAVAGAMHHGKTSLLDLLVDATHVGVAATAGAAGVGADVKAEDATEAAALAAADASLKGSHKPGSRVAAAAGAGAINKGKARGAASRLSDTAMAAQGQAGSARYLDSRMDEQERGISLKAKPISLVLPDLNGKSHLLNWMDTPGHLSLSGEATAAFRLADGLLLCVCAVEGVTLATERLLTHAVQQGLSVVLCITKLDRLVVEEHIPPSDAYYKLAHIVTEVNSILIKLGSTHRVDVAQGSVVFASAEHRWAFSVPSFAQAYAKHHQSFSAEKFARRLWGNVFLAEDRSFTVKPQPGQPRTFVQFILEPLWKIYAHTLGADGPNVAGLCEEIGVPISAAEVNLDVKPLLRLILSRFFDTSASVLAHAAAKHVPSPVAAARSKVAHSYSGDLTSPAAAGMLACDAKAPLVVQIAKSYARADLATFDSFGRVLAGTARVGDKVRVLGPRYSPDDPEDMVVQEITRIWVLQAGRYRVEVNRVTAGNWALFEGLDKGVGKAATVAALEGGEDIWPFSPLAFTTLPLAKVALEPNVPSELPKLLEGLRKVVKCYPLAETKVEESGEHVLLGAGELDLDCMLHDLRRLYSEVEIKVSDPTVRFSETVAETSSIRCFAETPNKANLFSFLAEPLDQAIADDLEAGLLLPAHLSPHGADAAAAATAAAAAAGASASSSSVRPEPEAERRRIASFFQDRYGWDALAARSIWAFGPDAAGPNILCDDTLPSEVDPALLATVREPLIEGFRWAVQSGPLCDEPVRGVKFRLLDARISDDPQQRALRHVLPTARRITYAALLLAAPRLLEPVYLAEITAPVQVLETVNKALSLRRGHVISSQPRAGTPFHTLQAYVPLIDAFGLETDVRATTLGTAYVSSVFDHWGVVPGDPLDRSIVLKPLAVAPRDHLARDFTVKTRRRKGLGEDVNVERYFDEAMLLELAKQVAEGGGGGAGGM